MAVLIQFAKLVSIKLSLFKIVYNIFVVKL